MEIKFTILQIALLFILRVQQQQLKLLKYTKGRADLFSDFA